MFLNVAYTASNSLITYLVTVTLLIYVMIYFDVSWHQFMVYVMNHWTILTLWIVHESFNIQQIQRFFTLSDVKYHKRHGYWSQSRYTPWVIKKCLQCCISTKIQQLIRKYRNIFCEWLLNSELGWALLINTIARVITTMFFIDLSSPKNFI